MNIAGWFLRVIAMVAVPIALFEVWGMTHYRVGWGEPLPRDKAWGKPMLRKAPFRVVGPQLLTRYHFVMYCGMAPAAVLLLGFSMRHRVAHPPASWVGWLLFLVAGAMGVMVLEDILFFVFSTLFGRPYPDALGRLLRGEASWHPVQIDFWGWFRLPAVYIWGSLAVGFLLWLMGRCGGV